MQLRLARSIALLCLSLTVVGATREATAERRTYLRVYEPEVNGKDVMDVFFRNQLEHTFGQSSTDAVRWTMKLQYGVGERFDLAVYQNFRQKAGQLAYYSSEIEARYLLAPRGEWPVDVMVYGELGKIIGANHLKIEPKVFIGKACNSWRWALNVGSEINRHTSDTTVTADVRGAGGYDVSEALRLGAEVEAAWQKPTGETAYKPKVSAGPSLHWQPSPKVFTTVYTAFGLTDNATDLNAGFLLGIWFL